MTSNSLRQENFTPGKILSYILPILIVIPIVFIFSGIGDEYGKLAAFIAIPIVLFSILNFNLNFSILISLLFLGQFLIGYSIATLFVFIVVLSFFLTFNHIKPLDFRSGFNLLFLVYIISTLPSFFNNSALSNSIPRILNLVTFFLIVNITFAYKPDNELLKKHLNLFLFLTVLNGLVIILQGLSSNMRVFGFTGIMYVDYVGLSIILTLLLALFTNRTTRILLLFLALFYTFSLLVTQTRNPFITIGLTALFMIIYLIKNSDFYKVSRKLLITVSLVGAIFISGLFITLSIVSPEITERTQELTEENKEIISEEGTTTSSLISRVFIWSNAAYAFSLNPISGVGLYAFPYVNYKYNKLPTFVFEEYVMGKTPHQTFIAILVETGIVGFIGFLVLVTGSFLLIISSIKLCQTHIEKKISILLLTSQMYIFFSMFVTDAWLWHQGMILWGIVLGLNLANRRYLKNKYNNEPILS